MINKQSLWFLTLFSLILVLSIYYITMPSDLLLNNNSNYIEENNEEAVVKVEESELLVNMRNEVTMERDEEVNSLKETLTNEETTSDEKNNAFEQIRLITNLNVEEASLESKIKNEYGLDSFIRINNNEIKVVAIKKDHDIELANNIMNTIQKEFENKVYVTVKFES